jgi:hypothetical protein
MTVHGKTPVSPINNIDVLLQLLDLLPTSIFFKDQNLKFVFSNETHCKIIGSEADGLSGLLDAGFYPAHQAKEFMAAGGDEIPADPSFVPNINITSIRTARGIEISVVDNGPGISEENPSKIREPLFMTKSFGAGPGLPAAGKILEEHDGGLDVTSAPGKGSSFTAWFPIIETFEEAA